jgi:hypothetical protein
LHQKIRELLDERPVIAEQMATRFLLLRSTFVMCLIALPSPSWYAAFRGQPM